MIKISRRLLVKGVLTSFISLPLSLVAKDKNRQKIDGTAKNQFEQQPEKSIGTALQPIQHKQVLLNSFSIAGYQY